MCGLVPDHHCEASCCLCRQPQPGSGFSNSVPGPIAQPSQQAPPGLQGPHLQPAFSHFTSIAPGLPQPGPSVNVDFSGQGNHAGQQILQQGPPPGNSRYCWFFIEQSSLELPSFLCILTDCHAHILCSAFSIRNINLLLFASLCLGSQRFSSTMLSALPSSQNPQQSRGIDYRPLLLLQNALSLAGIGSRGGSLPRDQGPNLPEDVFDTAETKSQSANAHQLQLGPNQVRHLHAPRFGKPC